MDISLEGLLRAIILSLVVSTVSVTLSKAKVFKWLRLFLGNKSQWLKGLIHCPY